MENKSKVGKANIKAGKKAGARTVASIDNSADGGNKLIDQPISLTGLAFAALTAANCAGNSNFTFSEKIPLSAIISTLNKFFAIFTAFANTTLKKK